MLAPLREGTLPPVEANPLPSALIQRSRGRAFQDRILLEIGGGRGVVLVTIQRHVSSEADELALRSTLTV